MQPYVAIDPNACCRSKAKDKQVGEAVGQTAAGTCLLPGIAALRSTQRDDREAEVRFARQRRLSGIFFARVFLDSRSCDGNRVLSRTFGSWRQALVTLRAAAVVLR